MPASRRSKLNRCRHYLRLALDRPIQRIQDEAATREGRYLDNLSVMVDFLDSYQFMSRADLGVIQILVAKLMRIVMNNKNVDFAIIPFGSALYGANMPVD